jgi:hypothetical protein
MTFEGFRSHKSAFLGVALAVGIPGLFLGPAVMEPAYVILQPALGGMTLLAVEMLFALIIDFPLAALSSAVTCRIIRSDDPADGALAGALFLLVFLVLILTCIGLAFTGDMVASLALNDVFPPAMASATDALGSGTVALLMALLLGFDLTLCGAGGIVGYHASRLYRHASAPA